MADSSKPHVLEEPNWLSNVRKTKPGKFGTWRFAIAEQKMICDDETLALFDVAPDQWDEKLESFMARLHPDDLPAVQAAVQQTLATGVAYDITYRARTNDGTYRLIHAIGKPFYDEDGNPVFVGGCCSEG